MFKSEIFVKRRPIILITRIRKDFSGEFVLFVKGNYEYFREITKYVLKYVVF